MVKDHTLHTLPRSQPRTREHDQNGFSGNSRTWFRIRPPSRPNHRPFSYDKNRRYETIAITHMFQYTRSPWRSVSEITKLFLVRFHTQVRINKWIHYTRFGYINLSCNEPRFSLQIFSISVRVYPLGGAYGIGTTFNLWPITVVLFIHN